MPNKVKQQEETAIVFTLPSNSGNAAFTPGSVFVKFRPGLSTVAGTTPAFVGANSNATAGSLNVSLQVNNPTGMKDGDLLVAFLALHTPNQTITPPTGWTRYSAGSGTFMQFETYYKRAFTEPPNWTWGWTTGSDAEAAVLAYRPPDPNTLIETATPIASGSGPIISTGSIALSADSRAVFFGATDNSGSDPITALGGLTSRIKGSSLLQSFFCGDALSSANVLAAQSASGSVNTGVRWFAQALVLQPSGASTSSTEVGAVSDGYDFGVAPRTNTYEWRARVGFLNPNQYSECGIYLMTGDGLPSYTETAIASGDASVPASFVPYNLKEVGSVVYDGHNPGVASGRIQLHARQVAVVWQLYGQGNLDVSVNPYFMLVPIPDEVQT